MGKIFESIRFAWKYRRELSKLREGIWNVKVKIVHARSDNNVTKGEIIDILREADGILDDLIDMLENE